VINISKKRYKLHLTSEQLDILKRIFRNHDWFCNCDDFPNCKDFKMYESLKNRIDNLFDRHYNNQFKGSKGYSKMISKVKDEHTKMVLDIVKKKN
jgi:ssDNA-binding Zn-finger/Zn-ribbon topoisomerase 1